MKSSSIMQYMWIMVIHVSLVINIEVIASAYENRCRTICLRSSSTHDAAGQSRFTWEAISQQLGASPTYFHKLLRKLVSSDLITSVPGVKGGFKLKKNLRIYGYLIFI